MLNFFKSKVQRWASKQHKDDIQYFVDMLEGADLGGRALTVALATDLRHKVINTAEFADARSKGASAVMLNQLYQSLQKEGLLANAAGCAVCLHSERALNDLTLIPLAKRMWTLLEESFPYVHQAADEYEMLMGVRVDASDHKNIPFEFRTDKLP